MARIQDEMHEHTFPIKNDQFFKRKLKRLLRPNFLSSCEEASALIKLFSSLYFSSSSHTLKLLLASSQNHGTANIYPLRQSLTIPIVWWGPPRSKPHPLRPHQPTFGRKNNMIISSSQIFVNWFLDPNLVDRSRHWFLCVFKEHYSFIHFHQNSGFSVTTEDLNLCLHL